MSDTAKAITDFLKTGGYKGTITIHDHLKDNGLKISRKTLLKFLHTYAEPGDYVSIGGRLQKSWIM